MEPSSSVKKTVTKTRLLQIFALVVLFALGACSRPRPYAGSGGDFFWDSDQISIAPEDGTLHVRAGFVVEKGVFISTNNDSSFSLWRRTPIANARLRIEYQLMGNRADFSLPDPKAGRLTLATSSKFRLSDCRISLKAGLNILTFRTKPGSQLKIKAMTIGDSVDRKHLQEGDSLFVYPPPGTGEVTLAGKGRIEIKTVLFAAAEKETTKREIKTGLLSSTLKIPFSFPGRGYLKITAVSGRFSVSAYSSRPEIKVVARASRFTAKPDVFIFLLDACQPSHLGAYGYHRPTSPNIDRLAEDAMVFESAYANATYTRASVPSFFTGLFPDSDDSFSMAKITIPRFLEAQGYTVSVLSASFFVSDMVNFPRQGIQTFEYFPDWRLPAEKERIVSRFCNLLQPPAPRFVYLHYLEPHLPIVPPPPFRDMFSKDKKTNTDDALNFGTLPPPSKRNHNDQWEVFFDKDSEQEKDQIMFKLWHDRDFRHSRNLSQEQVQDVIDDYDSSIAYIDAEVGKLLACLKSNKIYDESLIVLMADHGEALYEHKQWFHGNNVFDETSRVPLIVKFPRKMGLTGKVERVVQLLDLFPTLADACGKSLPLEGRSLLEAALNPDHDDTLVISRSGDKIPVYGGRWRNWYYIYDMKTSLEQLYNLSLDRLQDVHAEHPGISRMFFLRLQERLKGSRDDNAGKGIDTSKLPKKEIENLKALGYL